MTKQIISQKRYRAGVVKAATGTKLTAKSWFTEAPLRKLGTF